MFKPTIPWIKSDRCHWPASVKLLAIQIIEQRAVLSKLHEDFAKTNMMDPAKITQASAIAEATIKLANHYRNLGKELAYYLSRVRPDAVQERSE